MSGMNSANLARMHKVGEVVGLYLILKRLPKAHPSAKQTKFVVRCMQCGLVLERYPNKFKLFHSELCELKVTAPITH